MTTARLPRAIAPLRRLLDRATADRIRRMPFADAGHGYDKFGLHPDWVACGAGLMTPLYKTWFRVTSHGSEHVPSRGGAVLACNHSGMIPLDAMMVWTDLVMQTDPPRAPRVVMDHFVGGMPFLSVLFARVGAVGGSRANFHELLDSGELVLVFPEGVPGIAKPFKDRYQLRPWREGHVEMAIRHGVPVVPVAVIGAEEQMPQLAKIDGIKLFGTPHLPIPATPVPLPVHYHVHYGPPVAVHETWTPQQSNDPEVLAEAAARVRDAVEDLIRVGLAQREGIFR